MFLTIKLAMNKLFILAIILFLVIMGIILAHKHLRKEQFNSYEHIISANGEDLINYGGINLTFPDRKVRAKDYKFKLDNGFLKTFGELVAMSGDYFGTKEPISDGKNIDDQKRRFNLLVSSITQSPSKDTWSDSYGLSTTTIPKIAGTLDKETNLVHSYLQSGKTAEQAYNAVGFQLDQESNVDTGGGSNATKVLSDLIGIDAIKFIPEGRYLQLAQFNWDHFGFDAMIAYFAGHAVATETAARGDLSKAYMLDAIASHFLTDYFAAGHISVPRRELHSGKGSIPPWSETIGDLLVKLMHDEGNKRGLTVANMACYSPSPEDKKLCRKWTAYGDKFFTDPRNKDNVEQIYKALQTSVDEVYQSYVNKSPVKSRVYLYTANPNVFGAMPDNKSETKTTHTTIPIYCNGKCSDLGPLWYKSGSTDKGCMFGSNDVCTRNTNNYTPMFYYDRGSNTLYKRTREGSMTSVLSGLIALLDFYPKKSSTINTSAGEITEEIPEELLFSTPH